MVVAGGLTTEVRDTGQLGPMIQAVEANTGEPPGVAVADKGYLTEHTLATLRGQGQRCLIGVGREGQRPARWPQGPETQRMPRLLRLPWARVRYAGRKTQAERPHA